MIPALSIAGAIALITIISVVLHITEYEWTFERSEQQYDSQTLPFNESYIPFINSNDIAATKRLQRTFYTKMKETAFRANPFAVLTDITSLYNDTVNYLIVGECDGYSGGELESYLFSDNKYDRPLRNWYGIMMEPVPINFQRLEQFLNESKVPNSIIDDQILRINAGFSNDTEYEQVDSHKTIDLRVPDLDLLGKAQGKKKEDIAHWVKYQIGSVRDQPILRKSWIVKLTVPAMNPMDIHQALVLDRKVYSGMARHGIIDVLQVDTEGFDATVVRNYVSWSKQYSIRPMFIQFEHKILFKYFPKELDSLRRFLIRRHYECVKKGGDTLCYLKK